MFSYGSGLAATMWSFQVNSSTKHIAERANILQRLDQRVAVDPTEYSKVMKLREDTHSNSNYKPVSPVDNLFPGTFYLDNVDELKRRHYNVRN